VPQTTVEKLGITTGTTTLVLGQSVSAAVGLLGPLLLGASFVDESTVKRPIVMLFADTVADIRAQARSAFDQTTPDGRFWIAYRKGAGRRGAAEDPTPLHRDTLQAALAEVGLDGVTLVSIDDIWSAMRVKTVKIV
jgi:hypothetical protein